MSEDTVLKPDAPAPAHRLRAFLDAAPFPLPPNADLDRVAKRLARDTDALDCAGPAITVQVLSSFLTDYLADHLVFMFARRGFKATIRQGDYGAIATAIFDNAHPLFTDPPDVILIAPTFRDLLHTPALNADPATADHAVEQEVTFWKSLWARLPAPLVQLSFDTPPTRALGELDGVTPGGVTHHARRVNLALGAHMPSNVTFVDAELLSREMGVAHWHDAHMYHLCKQPFSLSALPHVADALAAAASGLLGKSRRVLVMDLDNTLWGGIVGDDGLEGLELGPETAEGEAFTAFQTYASQLRSRGVILAVCSKNDPEIARQAFRKHPAMVIKESDIASFVANFNDKPSNLRRIAEDLNIGLDALVFVDDNPVERALVRRELPEVLCVELPENPALYAQALDACRAFALAHLTGDDLHRAQSYEARAKTQQALASTSDMDGFLASLDAKAYIEPLSPQNQDRIQQLLAKTNQFKLNPNVMTGDDLTAQGIDVIALRLVDRMQDYGIVSVAVINQAHATKDTMVIENWVMSCRVFSRRLEYVMFEEILTRAQQGGFSKLALTYTPSGRNGLVGELLDKFGFNPTGSDDTFVRSHVALPDGEDTWPPHHMRVVRP